MTTLRLWLERHRIAGRRQRGLITLSVVLVAGLAAALATVVLVQPKASGGPGHVAARSAGQRGAVADQDLAGQGGTATAAAGPVREQAAGWVAQEVSPAAIVACDPVMCSALEAAGLSSGRLLVVQPASSDPLGSDIVVATPAVRGQFGPRLASVYAPQVIAGFGYGGTRIDIRTVAPDGPGAFQASLATDRAARISAGRQLLRNHHVHASADATAVLAGGSVDPRLLASLAALAAKQRVNIAAFGDPSPGAPGVPLRGIEITASTLAKLRPMLSFLRARRSPYQPAEARITRVARNQYMLSVRYDAPSPLGLGSGP